MQGYWLIHIQLEQGAILTAEVAIITRSGVAVAADSAVTVGRERVWKSANKLFSLSPSHDIGVMIFGNGDFCGAPWEVIIKEFRNSVSGVPVKYVENIVDMFFAFLSDIKIPREDENSLSWLFAFTDAKNFCESSIQSEKAIEARRQFIEAAKGMKGVVSEFDLVLDGVKFSDFSKKYGEVIEEIIGSDFNFSVTKELRDEFKKLCFEMYIRKYESNAATGVVFAGFGSLEIFPTIIELVVDGKSDGKSRAWIKRNVNLNEKNRDYCEVIPFAQADISHLLLQGIQPGYLEYIENFWSLSLENMTDRYLKDYVSGPQRSERRKTERSVNAEIVKGFVTEFRQYMRNKTIQPMMEAISSLPREEVCAMSEALVEMTSLRRRIDSSLETVGGPVDVAFISKSDGFIWIKRKFYFDSKLNYDFPARRQNRLRDNGNGGGANEI